MQTAVDSSVILDILTADPQHADRAEAALRKAVNEGALMVCEIVLAEIAPAFPCGGDDVVEFMNDWGLSFVPSTRQSALLAGAMFRTYLARRAEDGPRRVVTDFLIGAHAKCTCDHLLARDRGYCRDHFKGLRLLAP